jgi:ElaB/YqjD/DUF883 family membrane-anchored ribosome-binding protein
MDDNNQPGQSYGEGTASSATGTAARMVSDKTTELKEKAAGFGRKTAEKIDDSRESAAGALDRTASSLHASADQLSSTAHSATDRVQATAHSAADKIQATADYVRQTDLKGMVEDVQDIVKRYPVQSLAAAAVLGFLVARGLRSNND